MAVSDLSEWCPNGCPLAYVEYEPYFGYFCDMCGAEWGDLYEQQEEEARQEKEEEGLRHAGT